MNRVKQVCRHLVDKHTPYSGRRVLTVLGAASTNKHILFTLRHIAVCFEFKLKHQWKSKFRNVSTNF